MQYKPVFLYTGDFILDDNERILKFTENQENAVISDPSHFSISNNELVVHKSGIYKIHFTNIYVNTQISSIIYFRSTNLKDGKQTNKKIATLNNTNYLWTFISIFFVIKLTADVERHTIVHDDGRFIKDENAHKFYIRKIG